MNEHNEDEEPQLVLCMERSADFSEKSKGIATNFKLLHILKYIYHFDEIKETLVHLKRTRFHVIPL